MDLKDYSLEDLKKEILTREKKNDFKKWNTIPDNVLPTKVNNHSTEDIIKISQKEYIDQVGDEDVLVEDGCPEIHHMPVEEIGRYWEIWLCFIKSR